VRNGDYGQRPRRVTACSFAVSAHAYWSWAARTVRTAIPLFILGHTLNTCRSLDMRRLGSIRRYHLLNLV
jgi:hypothetical protein